MRFFLSGFVSVFVLVCHFSASLSITASSASSPTVTQQITTNTQPTLTTVFQCPTICTITKIGDLNYTCHIEQGISYTWHYNSSSSSGPSIVYSGSDITCSATPSGSNGSACQPRNCSYNQPPKPTPVPPSVGAILGGALGGGAAVAILIGAIIYSVSGGPGAAGSAAAAESVAAAQAAVVKGSPPNDEDKKSIISVSSLENDQQRWNMIGQYLISNQAPIACNNDYYGQTRSGLVLYGQSWRKM